MKFSDDFKRSHAAEPRTSQRNINISNMAKRMTLNSEKCQVQVLGEKELQTKTFAGRATPAK